MLDSSVRSRIIPGLNRVGHRLADRGVRANHATGLGFAVGVGACVAVGLGHWGVGLVLWLVNRALDGLDGSIARAHGPTEMGGFLDIVADFAIYGGLLVGFGVAGDELRLPALVCFLAYYLNGTAFLAWSSLAERLQLSERGDERSLDFSNAGITEGTETIIVMSVLLLWREQAETILWIWAGAVLITASQRVFFTTRRLRDYRHDQGTPESAS